MDSLSTRTQFDQIDSRKQEALQEDLHIATDSFMKTVIALVEANKVISFDQNSSKNESSNLRMISGRFSKKMREILSQISNEVKELPRDEAKQNREYQGVVEQASNTQQLRSTHQLNNDFSELSYILSYRIPMLSSSTHHMTPTRLKKMSSLKNNSPHISPIQKMDRSISPSINSSQVRNNHQPTVFIQGQNHHQTISKQKLLPHTPTRSHQKTINQNKKISNRKIKMNSASQDNNEVEVSENKEIKIISRPKNIKINKGSEKSIYKPSLISNRGQYANRQDFKEKSKNIKKNNVEMKDYTKTDSKEIPSSSSPKMIKQKITFTEERPIINRKFQSTSKLPVFRRTEQPNKDENQITQDLIYQTLQGGESDKMKYPQTTSKKNIQKNRINLVSEYHNSIRRQKTQPFINKVDAKPQRSIQQKNMSDDKNSYQNKKFEDMYEQRKLPIFKENNPKSPKDSRDIFSYNYKFKESSKSPNSKKGIVGGRSKMPKFKPRSNNSGSSSPKIMSNTFEVQPSGKQTSPQNNQNVNQNSPKIYSSKPKNIKRRSITPKKRQSIPHKSNNQFSKINEDHSKLKSPKRLFYDEEGTENYSRPSNIDSGLRDLSSNQEVIKSPIRNRSKSPVLKERKRNPSPDIYFYNQSPIVHNNMVYDDSNKNQPNQYFGPNRNSNEKQLNQESYEFMNSDNSEQEPVINDNHKQYKPKESKPRQKNIKRQRINERQNVEPVNQHNFMEDYPAKNNNIDKSIERKKSSDRSHSTKYSPQKSQHLQDIEPHLKKRQGFQPISELKEIKKNDHESNNQIKPQTKSRPLISNKRMSKNSFDFESMNRNSPVKRRSIEGRFDKSIKFNSTVNTSDVTPPSNMIQLPPYPTTTIKSPYKQISSSRKPKNYSKNTMVIQGVNEPFKLMEIPPPLQRPNKKRIKRKEPIAKFAHVSKRQKIHTEHPQNNNQNILQHPNKNEKENAMTLVEENVYISNKKSPKHNETKEVMILSPQQLPYSRSRQKEEGSNNYKQREQSNLKTPDRLEKKIHNKIILSPPPQPAIIEYSIPPQTVYAMRHIPKPELQERRRESIRFTPERKAKFQQMPMFAQKISQHAGRVSSVIKKHQSSQKHNFNSSNNLSPCMISGEYRNSIIYDLRGYFTKHRIYTSQIPARHITSIANSSNTGQVYFFKNQYQIMAQIDMNTLKMVTTTNENEQVNYCRITHDDLLYVGRVDTNNLDIIDVVKQSTRGKILGKGQKLSTDSYMASTSYNQSFRYAKEDRYQLWLLTNQSMALVDQQNFKVIKEFNDISSISTKIIFTCVSSNMDIVVTYSTMRGVGIISMMKIRQPNNIEGKKTSFQNDQGTKWVGMEFTTHSDILIASIFHLSNQENNDFLQLAAFDVSEVSLQNKVASLIIKDPELSKPYMMRKVKGYDVFLISSKGTILIAGFQNQEFIAIEKISNIYQSQITDFEFFGNHLVVLSKESSETVKMITFNIDSYNSLAQREQGKQNRQKEVSNISSLMKNTLDKLEINSFEVPNFCNYIFLNQISNIYSGEKINSLSKKWKGIILWRLGGIVLVQGRGYPWQLQFDEFFKCFRQYFSLIKRSQHLRTQGDSFEQHNYPAQ